LGRIPYLRIAAVKITIVTPEDPNTTLGNSVTARRWAGLLQRLGHETAIVMEWDGEPCDMLIALHAGRSYPSIQWFRNAYADHPLIVALTGTDLYGSLPSSLQARESIAMATRLIVLQEAALDELDGETLSKTRVIYQSAQAPSHREDPAEDSFDVCVLSHLREVKDPLRAALAARQLDRDSRVRILHAGGVLESGWEERARDEERANPRYRWLGDLNHDDAIQLLARCRLFVLSSMMEGGSSAISEAVVCGIPLLCSDIPGNRGMLGSIYPGFYPVQDTSRLAELLRRAEKDSGFISDLRTHIDALAPRYVPALEMDNLRRLLKEVNPG
jgi:putative glycosyltransferase (TIGR04348 family)